MAVHTPGAPSFPFSPSRTVICNSSHGSLAGGRAAVIDERRPKPIVGVGNVSVPGQESVCSEVSISRLCIRSAGDGSEMEFGNTAGSARRLFVDISESSKPNPWNSDCDHGGSSANRKVRDRHMAGFLRSLGR